MGNSLIFYSQRGVCGPDRWGGRGGGGDRGGKPSNDNTNWALILCREHDSHLAESPQQLRWRELLLSSFC